jgi:YHS domain-containing protein
MDWLSQHWIWVVFGIAAAMYLFRGGLGGHGDHSVGRAATNPPEAAVDPMSGEAVRAAQALTSFYGGKIYYFATKENRDRFEAAPREHAAKAAGDPVAAAPQRRPRRGGCC